MWLLSKGRLKEAEKSLQWLRGWVSASEVQNELNELIRYSNASKLILKDKTPKETASNKEKSTYTNPVNLDDEVPTHNIVAGNPDVIKFTIESNTGIISDNNNAQSKPSKVQIIPSERSTSNVERKATFKETLQDLIRPQMLKPFFLVVAFFVFHNGSGFPAIRPYMVTVFEELRFPVDAHWATVSD